MARPEADDFEDDGMSVAEKRRRAEAKEARREKRRRACRWFLRGYGVAFVVLAVLGVTHAADEAARVFMMALFALAPVAVIAQGMTAPTPPATEAERLERRETRKAANRRTAARVAGACFLLFFGYLGVVMFAIIGDTLFSGGGGRELAPIVTQWFPFSIPVGIVGAIFMAMAGQPVEHGERWPFTSRHIIQRITRR
jgi:hypothetical protein